jgi:predicted N-acetyltransferase YhbS
MTARLETRAAGADDLPAVLDLLRRSMGRADDERFDALFRWKHLDNAFGPSPMWVACDGERVVAFRTFMRWEFQRGDEVFRCVRAVDTATHPDYQGRGLFTQLTRAALPELAADGVAFVFNTPNAQSRPGYLKMGWTAIGRASAYIRPLSSRGAIELVRSRVPASHWSEPATFGIPAEELLDDERIEGLVARPSGDDVLRTRVTRSFLQWRYASSVLAYRAIVPRGGIEQGVALTRVRRRGNAREVVVATFLGVHSDGGARRRLSRAVRSAARGHASYLLGIGAIPGFVPVPSFGPIVTTRDVSQPAPRKLAEFALSLGDIELF